MKVYKGFKADMTCRGYQFAVGIKAELPAEEKLIVCTSGFHACLRLFDVQHFYRVEDSHFFECEASDAHVVGSDGKTCHRWIIPIRELTFAECMAGFNLKEDGSEFKVGENTNIGFGNRGNYNVGNNNRGNYNFGNDNHGNGNCGNGNCGNGNVGNNNRGNYNHA